MILLIDIGNSRIKIGLCKNPNTRNNIDVFYCENINKINSVLEKIYQYEFDTDNIHLRPATKISNKCLKIPIKIDIKGKKKHFLIQTPKMYIPFGVNNNEQYNNKNTYLDISFRDKDYNTYVKNFYNFLKKVRMKIKKLLISEKIIKKNKNSYPEFIDSIKKDKYGERMTTRFNNIDGNHNVNIYDNKKDIKNIINISSIIRLLKVPFKTIDAVCLSIKSFVHLFFVTH